jgi:4-amino-4-deoxy-L-arabinose transferase-like glycosyltransferase
MFQAVNETMPATRPSARAIAPLWRELLVVGGACAFLSFYGLAALGLVGADEPRYAQIAREMLERHDWVVPILYGKPWLEKPILYYWQAMLSYGIFGVSDWAARLPVACNATALVLAVYFFARRFRPGLQLDAALIVASMAGVIGFGRAASMDMPLSAAFTIAMLSWLAWHQTGAGKWLAFFYVFIGLGTLAKGPVAPLLAALIIVVFAAIRREWRIVLRTLWLPGILLFLAVALPWYVAVQVRVPEFFRVFILEHNLARYSSDVYRHSQPFWFYVPVFLLALLPWTALAIVAAVRALRKDSSIGDDVVFKRDHAIAGLLLVWAIVPPLFFSFSGSKLPGYILPALPAWALLIVEWLYRKLSRGERAHPLLVLGHSLISIVPLGAALLSRYIVYRMEPPPGAYAIAASIVAIVIFVMAAALSLRGFRMLRLVTLLPVVLGLTFLIRVGAPAIDSTQSARPVANEIRQLGLADTPIAGLNIRRETEYGLAYYLNRPIALYERNEKPATDHLLVSRETELKPLAGEKISWVGSYPAQQLYFYWVSLSSGPEKH